MRFFKSFLNRNKVFVDSVSEDPQAENKSKNKPDASYSVDRKSIDPAIRDNQPDEGIEELSEVPLLIDPQTQKLIDLQAEINGRAVRYLSRKSHRVDKVNVKEFNSILDRLRYNKASISDDLVLASLQKCFASTKIFPFAIKGNAYEETHTIDNESRAKASQLESFYKSSLAVKEAIKSVEKFNLVHQKADEVVEYMTSGLTKESKAMMKSKGYKEDSQLTKEDKDAYKSTYDKKQTQLVSEYKAMRVDLDHSRHHSRQSAAKLGEISIKAPIGFFKKIRNFFRDLFSVFSGTNKSTSTLLKSFKNIVDDNLINSLDSDKLKVKDLAVQSQISMQIDDKYNLFCHPIHNISGSVLAYKMTNSSSSEAIDLKVSTAERAFQAASSVLNVECQEFLNGRPPMGEDELKHRFRFDTKKDSRAYESARLGRPAEIKSPVELQHLYSNLLLLESEMSEFRDQIKVDSQVDSQISSPDLDEAIASYESDLSIAKELIDAKAQEMGVNLQDVKAKTLADDISDTASDTLSYYESTISDSEKSSDIGDSEKSSEETKESDGQPKLKQLHARVDHSKLISGSFLEHEIAKREKSGKSEDHTH